MGLNAALAERVERLAIEDPLTRAIHVKVSRLPERLRPAPHRQHRLHRRVDQGRLAHACPAYIPHIAGSFEGGAVAIGQRLRSRLPAKRVPEAVERWLDHYQRERARRRAVHGVRRAHRHRRAFEELVADLSLPPQFSLETMSHFVDWNRSEPFQVIRGEGECAV